MITRRAAKLLESSGAPISDALISITQNKERKTLVNGTNADTDFKLQKKLNTETFELYLEDLWSRISVEKRISFAYFDSLWFSFYKDGSEKSKVLQWIKKEQIFSRKYIFVPIICWRHWNLLILCHFGEKRKSKIKQPCMLLLDSLQNLNPKRLEPHIRRFVLDIYRSEGRKEPDEFISKIPLLIPKVPQQRSGEECGIFVLYFLYLFLQSAPDIFSTEGYPYFEQEDHGYRLKGISQTRVGALSSICLCSV
ncbi:probable ubiquitin-like-specific protease 2A isoform X2 [Asparagus officinalis]|uniref:probable ubiquitin-like-specific protease 2A isoform X2 n=1 Tax=Asparagus officinalis TaxID=4686 RepID=UPI00098E47AD|nr:probable ubiquitin-like-specific protease 2A isoform X2 [Asparagus officinalis]